MTRDDEIIAQLKSDEVLLEGMLASDIGSLCRRLARTASVQDVSRWLASDAIRIRMLCMLIRKLIDELYEPEYRHPNDLAICAGLVVLEHSPLETVRALFGQLRRRKEPSLVWVSRMAEFCDERWITTTRSEMRILPDDDAITSVPRILNDQQGGSTSGDVTTEYFDLAAVA